MKHWEKHPSPVDGCFGCKALTLSLPNPGMAHSGGRGFGRDLDKKNDRELDYYSDLRKQGIQPAGTTYAKCLEADKKSQEYGTAWDAGNPVPILEKKVLEKHG